jgi:hypothetical protein
MGISLLLVGMAFSYGWTGYGLLLFILLDIAVLPPLTDQSPG